MAIKKSAGNKTATKKTSAKKTTARKTAAKKTPGKKSTRSSAENYTKPELRERVKKQVVASAKGGRAGQWSARKAQIVAHDYEAKGGGYKQPRSAGQKSLKQWGDGKWHTSDGKQAIQGKKTKRYLPDAAWKKLSPEQRKATNQKKVAASKRGKQFVANTPAAAKARKRASHHNS